MKVFLTFILMFLVETSTTYNFNDRKVQNNRKNLSFKSKWHTNIGNQQKQQQYDDEEEEFFNGQFQDGNYADNSELYNAPEAEAKIDSLPHIEIDMLQCPQGCVCQYAHLMDLPISRWINFMQQKYTRSTDPADNLAETNTQEDEDYIVNNNESSQESDMSYVKNPFVKQATCIIQEDTNAKALINALPHDMHALVLLYTGIGRNKSVNTSILKPLNHLTTLEVRGPQDRGFRLVLDAPLKFLKYANFESITLMGSEVLKRPSNVRHPKEIFNYKPNIELLNNMDFNEKDANTKHYDHKLLVELQQQEQEELEIVPYEVYVEEVKKAKMPSFYGWDNLEVLRIQSCGLNDLSWEMFMGMDELKHLSLERNDIQVVPPFSLSGATQLKTLSLAHNAIHDLHYRNLAGLFELHVLDLSDNRLTKLTELSFPPLPKVERVDFRFNPMRYIFPATFWVMNNTREMYFGSNDISLELWGNQPFKKLRKLTTLEINNVSIQVLEQNIFKDLISLRKLKLRGHVSSVEFDAFSSLTELEKLDLASCHINEISMDAFIGCKELKVIDLSSNNISYIPPGLFDDQSHIEEIYLNKNHIKTLPTTFFQKRTLMVARLNDNPWKCSCEMVNWKAKITNQETAPVSERCINDYFTGKELSCRKFRNYKFNKQLAPRCENFKGRSVYYVLRKQMQCGSKYIQLKTQVSANHRMPHWRKLEESQRDLKKRTRLSRVNNSTYPQNSILWQLQKQNINKTSLINTRMNTLDYQISKISNDNDDNSDMLMKAEPDEDISNDILTINSIYMHV